MSLGQPGGDCGVELIEMAREKVVCVFNNDEVIFSGQHRDSFLHLFSRAEFVVGTVNEEFWFGAIRKKRKITPVYGDADADQFAYARITAANPKTHDTSKAEPREEQRNARKLCSEIVERRLHIALLAASFVVLTRAQTCTAKIETEHWNSQGVKGFCRVINHLVVHGAAKERVGMANDRCQRGGIRAGGRPEDRLQTAGGAFQEQIL